MDRPESENEFPPSALTAQHTAQSQCISINTLAEIKAYNNFINDEDQPGEEENGGKKNSNEKKSFSRSWKMPMPMPE
jgi:hypothetical protein